VTLKVKVPTQVVLSEGVPTTLVPLKVYTSVEGKLVVIMAYVMVPHLAVVLSLVIALNAIVSAAQRFQSHDVLEKLGAATVASQHSCSTSNETLSVAEIEGAPFAVIARA